jgi:hypothetical protein
MWPDDRTILKAVPPTGAPEVAEYLPLRPLQSALDRYKGTGPKFIKHGSSVLHRWSDLLEWLDRNTI